MPKIKIGGKITEQLKEDLRKTREELAIQKWGLEKTLGGMKVLVKELVQKGKEIEKVDKAKTEFISIASHQLRTPVSALNWLIEGLQFKATNLTPKQQTYAMDLSGQAKRLTELVEDLLDFSRIEMKTTTQEKQLIEITGLVEEFVREMELYATAKKHTLILNKKTIESLTVEINKRSLYNILQNILSNAIDYSPADTVVTINLEKIADAMKISISNKGPAIPKDDQPRIFEKFYRTEDAKKMKVAGTGLGLYIVKATIEEIGGEVGFDSEPDQDTVFWFSIPLKLNNKNNKNL